jgi:hypothetical protein
MVQVDGGEFELRDIFWRGDDASKLSTFYFRNFRDITNSK